MLAERSPSLSREGTLVLGLAAELGSMTGIHIGPNIVPQVPALPMGAGFAKAADWSTSPMPHPSPYEGTPRRGDGGLGTSTGHDALEADLRRILLQDDAPMDVGTIKQGGRL